MCSVCMNSVKCVWRMCVLLADLSSATASLTSSFFSLPLSLTLCRRPPSTHTHTHPPSPSPPLQQHQLGPDSNITSVLSDLFVQMSSKAAFHELRTRQRLGYSVHLGGSSLQRQLGVVVRVQSPSVNPGVIAGAVRGWLGAWRGELVALADEKLDTFKQVCEGVWVWVLFLSSSVACMV